jgi:hypothetical protein
VSKKNPSEHRLQIFSTHEEASQLGSHWAATKEASRIRMREKMRIYFERAGFI